VKLRNSVVCLKAQCIMDTNSVSYDKNFPPLQQDIRPSTSNATAFSSIAADLHQDDFLIANHAGIKKGVTRKAKPVVGKATNQKLTSVSTRRNVDVFVSRLHPLTESDDIIECVTTTYVLIILSLCVCLFKSCTTKTKGSRDYDSPCIFM